MRAGQATPRKSLLVRGRSSMSRVSLAMIPLDDSQALTQARKEAALQGGAESADDGKLLKSEAIASFVIGCVGAGIVVVPKLMGENGWLMASGLLLLATAVCLECGQLILNCVDLAETVQATHSGSVASLEAVAVAAFGRAGQAFLACTMSFYQLGTILAYTVMLAGKLQGLFPFFAGELVRWLIMYPLLVGLCMITNLKDLASVTPFGSVAVAVQCFSICLGSSCSAWLGGGGAHPAVNFSMNKIGGAISVFVFGFDGIASLPCLRGQMRQPDEARPALFTGLSIVAGFCFIVMALGFAGYGSDVGSNVIDSLAADCAGPEHPGTSGLQCWLGYTSSLSIMINLFISCPLIFFVHISFLQSLMRGAAGVALTPPNIALRAGIIFVLCLIGSMLPFVKDIITLVSAVFGSVNSIFAPMVFFYRLRYLAASRGIALPTISAARGALHALIVVTGAVAMIFGVLSALEDISVNISTGSGTVQ